MSSLVVQLTYGLLSLLAPLRASDGLVVQTPQGSVVGTLLDCNTRQFLGIPYAARSLRRFQPPVPPPVRSQPFNASNWGDSCPMELSNSTRVFLKLAGLYQQQLDVTISENCLNLNTWAPVVERPQKTAVMIWVYCGSGMYGTSNTPLYNGSYFTKQYEDVTIVTINYRTNLFGFPNAPGSLNVGSLDIEEAVQWVYNNIAGFGGDPERITLFGESFGSLAVDAYAYSHPHDTIVKGLILESGVVYLYEWLKPNATAWDTLASSVGCNDLSLQIQCMQGLPWQVLAIAVNKYQIGFTASPDEHTMFSDWRVRQLSGQYLQVPTLIGNNHNEGDLFVDVYQEMGRNLTQSLFNKYSALLTNVLFHCPEASSSTSRRFFNTDTYRYIYSGVFDDITNKTANLRAFHTAEIPLVFNTYNLSASPYNATYDEVSLRNFMQGSWVDFARNPSAGLELLHGWRRYNPKDLRHGSINVLGKSTGDATGIAFETTLMHDTGCKDLTAAVEPVKRLMKRIKHF